MNRLRMGWVLVALVGGSAWAHEPQAAAPRRPVRLAVYGLLPDWGLPGVGAGATVGVPVLHEGFSSALDDELDVALSVDTGFNVTNDPGYGLLHFFLSASALWGVHFEAPLFLSLRLGAGLGISPGSLTVYYPFPIAMLGLTWMPSQHVGLTLEAGYPGARLGVAFAF